MTSPQEALQKAREQDGGWIEHDGKGMPVERDVLVHVKFRDGDEAPRAETAGFWHDFEDDYHSNWVHVPDSPCDAEIVAYRLHTPTPSSSEEKP